MRLTILSAICFVTFFSAHAQVPTLDWQSALGGSAYDQAESVVETFDGGCVVAGIATSTDGDVTGNHGFGDYWIVKLDSFGILQWENTYGGSADEAALAVMQTSDSGYAIAGGSTSSDGDATFNHGFNDFWVIKTDADGNIQWQKSLGGSSTDIAYDIREVTDGGYIVAGYTQSNDGDITSHHGSEDCWIVKLDSAGTIQWQNTYGGNKEERVQQILQTLDGGYIASGFTKSNDDDVSGNHGDYDYWIFKIDSIGNLEWQHTYGGTKSDQCYAISQTSDHHYVAAGFTESSNGDVTSNHGSQDVWLIMIDSVGNLEWEKSLGGSGGDFAYDVKQNLAGDLIVGATSFSTNGDVSGNHGGEDYWTIKTDLSGNIIWESSFGGSSVDEADAIAATDNGYIVAGGTLSNDGDVTGNHGDFDYWVIKISDAIATSAPFDSEQNESLSLQISPNPFIQAAKIIYNLPADSYVSIDILSVTGQKISALYDGYMGKGNHTYSLSRQNDQPGMYLVRVITDNKTIIKKVIEN